jgi:hypothetical protein
MQNTIWQHSLQTSESGKTFNLTLIKIHDQGQFLLQKRIFFHRIEFSAETCRIGGSLFAPRPSVDVATQ